MSAFLFLNRNLKVAATSEFYFLKYFLKILAFYFWEMYISVNGKRKNLICETNTGNVRFIPHKKFV